MSDTDPIEAAARRLSQALEALEAASERRREADGASAQQAHVLGSDRARLASQLDDATARARALEAANREVAQRIDQAIETIRGVLEFGN
jgi:Domain of unknown function (DUF4164)